VVILVVLTTKIFMFDLPFSQLMAKAIPVRRAKFEKPALKAGFFIFIFLLRTRKIAGSRLEPLSRLHNNAAKRLRCLSVFMGRGGVSQREDTVNHNPEAPFRHSLQHLVHTCPDAGSFKKRSHKYPHERLVRLHWRPQVDSQASAARITDEDETPFRSESRKRSLQRRPYRIDDEVNTGTTGILSDTVHDVILYTIHDMIGTQFKQPASSLRSACRGDDRRACL
jgi:hypothetical protein